MAVITISRELAALGDETARELARLLQYRFIEKQILEDRMRELGGTRQEIEKYDEQKPAFFASLSREGDNYLHYLKTAIFSEAEQGNCVFMGRGCAAILKGLPGTLSVFLSSPLEIRLERAGSYFHCDEKRARQIIEQSDRSREGFHRFFFDMKWKHPANYHLALNTGALHPQLCAELIKNMLEKTVSPELETSGALRLKDLILGQEIIQRVLIEKHIPVHFFEAAVSSGNVTLFGVANSQIAVESAVRIAGETPSVRSVIPEIQIVHEYGMIP